MSKITDEQVDELLDGTPVELNAQVIDLASVAKKRDKLREASDKMKSNRAAKLTRAELMSTLEKSNEVIDEQYMLLHAMTQDILRLAQVYREAQANMTMVSAQAYMALEIMKEKGLCTSEDLQSRWEKILREKVMTKDEEPLIQVQESAIVIPGPGQVDLRRK